MNVEDLKGKIDFGIITIRPDEFQAVFDRLDHIGFATGSRGYEICRLETNGGDEYHIALVRSIEQGNGEGQSVAQALIKDLDPQWLVVIGIAGGVPSKDFTLGDVVVAN